MLPRDAIAQAEQAIRRCELLIIVGTSGIVYPAAMLPMKARRAGAFIVDINPQYGPTADVADVFVRGPSGEVLPDLTNAVMERLEETQQ
jgi:NAD-dependent deacetylase